jgi:hypothetical protein
MNRTTHLAQKRAIFSVVLRIDKRDVGSTRQNARPKIFPYDIGIMRDFGTFPGTLTFL